MPKTLMEEFPSVIDVAYKAYKEHKHVFEIMTRDVVLVEPSMTMLDAAKIMGERHIGSVLVKGQDRPSGIVTERDLLTRVIAANKKPEKVKVYDIYSPRLITIKPSMTIREAARTMISQKGRLIVMEDRNLAGIVTASDLIRAMPESPEIAVPVKNFMTKEVKTAEPQDTVIEAAKTMGRERIGSVIITKECRPWGIFTERDLLTKVIYMGGKLEDDVVKHSSSPLITIGPDWSAHRAAKIMIKKHIRRLPVFDDSKMCGIVTARDLVEAYSM